MTLKQKCSVKVEYSGLEEKTGLGYKFQNHLEYHGKREKSPKDLCID